MERLQKVIAQAGIASRRKAEELIVNGNVTVNGKTVKELGVKVNAAEDDIRVNGQQIYIDEDKVTIIFNKPAKVITSMQDPEGRAKVIDYIHINQRVYPVGRLDYETEGLILLTNDGDLANQLMHPKYQLDKTYEAVVNGVPSSEDLKALRKGIMLEDGMTSPANVRIVEKSRMQRSTLQLTIHEGRNRQVRRMLAAVGLSVVKLTRIQYGFLTLDNLPTGEFRFLANNEINRLKELVASSID